MVTDNGIDWILLISEWWPVITGTAGALGGWHWCRYLAERHFRAQHYEISKLRDLNEDLAEENQRIIDFTNYLINEERK